MKKHVILIDPKKDNLQMFLQAFDEAGVDIKCTYADGCDHAAEMLKYIQADALFIQLDPGITDALEFVRSIKSTRRFRTVPTVVYSAHMTYYNFLAIGHGADHCMREPLAAAEIRKVLDDVLLWQAVAVKR
jgi:CheY-like chemotaxis protein